ncbi:40S ribosomal protein S17 [Sesamum alatum]|uniref:40S ribosomal protein S17 n=1 Tax=Sesamum alatum TaxID=300844 RepID=A0AAE1YM77_9LAMI|nr:40S ribosomal protein S17 [Sesamum alatum]
MSRLIFEELSETGFEEVFTGLVSGLLRADVGEGEMGSDGDAESTGEQGADVEVVVMNLNFLLPSQTLNQKLLYVFSPTSPPPPPATTRTTTEKMGRVRTKTVKKSSRQVIEHYYSKMTLDFHTNKKVLEEVAIIPSKRLRNKIAGFSTHLMKRIQKGPVRGISLKLQEEERERRMDFVPDESAIKIDRIEVDQETIDLLETLGMKELPGVVLREDQGPINVAPLNYGRGGARRY